MMIAKSTRELARAGSRFSAGCTSPRDRGTAATQAAQHGPRPSFCSRRQLTNMQGLEMPEEIKSVDYAPVGDPLVLPVSETIRRGVLKQMFLWRATDLTR
jgi:hypothetical protein